MASGMQPRKMVRLGVPRDEAAIGGFCAPRTVQAELNT